MITDTQNKSTYDEWADHVTATIARIAYAGSIYGYDKIVAARIWLENLNRHQAAKAAIHMPKHLLRRTRVRKDELAAALDEWDNEGGGLAK